MTRTQFLRSLGALAAAPFVLPACRTAPDTVVRNAVAAGAIAPADSLVFSTLDKPLEVWRELLSPDAFAVLFEDATERPFSSPLNAEKRPGTYLCAACFLPLFPSQTKFESGTGWPSFYAPLEGRLAFETDYKIGYPRTEYHCARCGGHQGHVFEDGPEPTGQRWCNNGVALRFVPEGEPLPDLRT